MQPIYLLNDNGLSGFGDIQDILITQEAYKDIHGWDAIKKALEEDKQAVVLISCPEEKVASWVAKLKATLPTVASIALLPNDPENISELLSLECDYLLPGANRFELLSRIQSAARQSDMKTTIEASAQLDEVTLLFNRRYFIDRLNSEISLSKRHLSPLSVVVIRVNFFQVYVDSYGYDFIIDLLKHVATVVRKQVRQEDLIARISDDEVGLLLPRSTEKGAKTVTDRIIHTLVDTPYKPFGLEEGDGEELSIYAGIAGFPVADDDYVDADSLIRYARHAVHQARCSGEELVQLFSEIQPVF